MAERIIPTAEDHANRIHNLCQIADELDADAETAPCSEAQIIREAADEIEEARERLSLKNETMLSDIERQWLVHLLIDEMLRHAQSPVYHGDLKAILKKIEGVDARVIIRRD